MINIIEGFYPFQTIFPLLAILKSVIFAKDVEKATHSESSTAYHVGPARLKEKWQARNHPNYL